MSQDGLLEVGGHEETPGLFARDVAVVIFVDALEIAVVLALQLG